MFGKRPDGRVVKSVAPLQKIMPYIMKTRTDSMNMYEEPIPCEGMDKYIKEKAEQDIKLCFEGTESLPHQLLYYQLEVLGN